MEQGIADNVLEMALRGKPKEPFYMVGRMEGQSVVLRAEKGKLRLMVDDEEGGGKQEMVYDVTAQGGERGERGEEDGNRREAESGEAKAGGEERTEGFGAYGEGEVPGGAVGMDGEAQTGRRLPGVGGHVDCLKAVALNWRLAVLLERKSKGGAMKELERRLARLQGMPVAKQGDLKEAAED